MLFMPVSDLVEEVKAELFSYDSLGEEKVLEWEQKFLQLIKDKKINKDSIKNVKGVNHFCFKDEAEIFSLADSFWVACENNEEDKYWYGLG